MENIRRVGSENSGKWEVKKGTLHLQDWKVWVNQGDSIPVCQPDFTAPASFMLSLGSLDMWVWHGETSPSGGKQQSFKPRLILWLKGSCLVGDMILWGGSFQLCPMGGGGSDDFPSRLLWWRWEGKMLLGLALPCKWVEHVFSGNLKGGAGMGAFARKAACFSLAPVHACPALPHNFHTLGFAWLEMNGRQQQNASNQWKWLLQPPCKDFRWMARWEAPRGEGAMTSAWAEIDLWVVAKEQGRDQSFCMLLNYLWFGSKTVGKVAKKHS